MSSGDRPFQKLSAREKLLDWAMAGRYRERATKYLELACAATDPGVRSRYVTIATHYRVLAASERRAAARRSEQRRDAGATAESVAVPVIDPRIKLVDASRIGEDSENISLFEEDVASSIQRRTA